MIIRISKITMILMLFALVLSGLFYQEFPVQASSAAQGEENLTDSSKKSEVIQDESVQPDVTGEDVSYEVKGKVITLSFPESKLKDHKRLVVSVNDLNKRNLKSQNFFIVHGEEADPGNSRDELLRAEDGIYTCTIDLGEVEAEAVYLSVRDADNKKLTILKKTRIDLSGADSAKDKNNLKNQKSGKDGEEASTEIKGENQASTNAAASTEQAAANKAAASTEQTAVNKAAASTEQAATDVTASTEQAAATEEVVTTEEETTAAGSSVMDSTGSTAGSTGLRTLNDKPEVYAEGTVIFVKFAKRVLQECKTVKVEINKKDGREASRDTVAINELEKDENGDSLIFKKDVEVTGDGIYLVTVLATNETGKETVLIRNEKVKINKSNTIMIVIIALICVLLLACAGAAFLILRKRRGDTAYSNDGSNVRTIYEVRLVKSHGSSWIICQADTTVQALYDLMEPDKRNDPDIIRVARDIFVRVVSGGTALEVKSDRFRISITLSMDNRVLKLKQPGIPEMEIIWVGKRSLG